MDVLRAGAAWACAVLLACAGAPDLRDASKSGVYGYLRLVPHEGLSSGTAGSPSGAYADRRYADAELVDYSRPGLAVVYLDGEGPLPTPAPLELEIHPAPRGVAFEPAQGAVAVGGEIRVRNRHGPVALGEAREVGVEEASGSVLRPLEAAPGGGLEVARQGALLEHQDQPGRQGCHGREREQQLCEDVGPRRFGASAGRSPHP
jgi:hypothetical protein